MKFNPKLAVAIISLIAILIANTDVNISRNTTGERGFNAERTDNVIKFRLGL